MKYLVPFILFTSLSLCEITPPKQQKYYISGVEFDTSIYCADFNDVIKQQAQKIKALEKEVAQLRQLQQQQLQESLEKKHQKAVQKEEKDQPRTDTKSMIIISDKPIH